MNSSSSDDKYETEVPKSEEIHAAEENNSSTIDNVTVEENNTGCSSSATNAVENRDVRTELKVGFSKARNGYIIFDNGGISMPGIFINGGSQNLIIYEGMSGIHLNANRKTINISATGIDVSDGTRRDVDDSRVMWICGNRNIIHANVFSIKVNGYRNTIHASKYQVQNDNSDVKNSEKCIINGNRNIIYASVKKIKQKGNRNITHFKEPGRLRLLNHNGDEGGEGVRITTKGKNNEIHMNGVGYEIGTSRLVNALFTEYRI